jgi:single-stranded-DNA-specific exonuclease
MDLLWELPGDLQHDKRTLHVAESLGLPVSIASVLVGNGVDTPKAVQDFFKPSVDLFYDPFSMKNMDDAVGFLLDALYERKRIAVYGDYDVDGVTSVALLTLFLKDIGGDVSYHIPERTSEGYGLSMAGVLDAHESGTSVLVTVDTGITAHREIAYARELGMEVVVCDHHKPAESLPDASAILNPKCKECDYPFEDLAAVGVVFKLCQAIAKHLDLDPDILANYMDLAAIGSAADIVPLVSENRVMVSLGLQKINDNPLVGVGALLQISGLLRRDVDVSSIIFGLAPRINAVGRLGSAERAVQLLSTKSRERALDIAQILEKENKERKSIDHETLDDAIEQVLITTDLAKDRVIVLAKRGWHSGVIGIVASRIIERYHRPTLMISIDEEGLGKGSARSIPGFDVYAALHSCSDLLEQFGGHKYAAGLTVREENIPELSRRVKEWCAARIETIDLCPRLRVDSEIPLRVIDRDYLEILKQFAPYGPHNQQPLFLSRSVRVKGPVRKVGSGHLVMRVSQDGIEFDAIGYGLGNRAEEINEPKIELDIVYSICENYWRGQSSIQLQLKDVCLAGVHAVTTRRP